MTVKEFLQPFYAAANMVNVNLYHRGQFFFIPVVAGEENLVPPHIAAAEVKSAKLDNVDDVAVLVINEDEEVPE